MQRSVGILVAISITCVLVLDGLHLLDPSTQLTQGQHVIPDNSTIFSTVVEEKIFQPDSTFQDQVTQLHASIDGREIPQLELEKYRIESPSFYFTLPENNILDLPTNTTTEAVSDGNWVFVKPLTPGKHEISFRGDVNSTQDNPIAESFAFPSGWNYSTTYKLVIR